ncbi:hypothetical protein BofuT4_P161900.1 [Botrytis cinerea T4]|uniref:Uncharacterized protein n=1 Tax=Botryotinia fuckeliana (strain T4) TaxID=999810 RepID=G2YSZ7_BOTF4|nr:hypothetical protein BofuT4_P161900.1 [Botrytis cinerea T4]
MDVDGDSRYKDIDSQSTSDITDFQPIKRRSYSLPSILLGCIASFVLAGFLITVVRWPWSKGDSGYYAYTDCGKTPEEARSRGCSYYPMGRFWAPPECSFPEGNDNYHPFRDREWFVDTNLTIPADISRLESGDARRAFTHYWHDEHCTFVLQKLALAVALKKTMVPGLVGSIHHVNHCAMTITKTIKNAYNETFLANDMSITESTLGFMPCVPLKSLMDNPGYEN